MLFEVSVIALLSFIVICCCLILANLNILTKDAIASGKERRELRLDIIEYLDFLERKYKKEIRVNASRVNHRLLGIRSSLKKNKKMRPKKKINA